MKYLNRKQKNLLLINQGHYIGNAYRGNCEFSPEQLADFKHMTSRVIENLRVPFEFIVQPLALPAGLACYEGDHIGVTASTRKLAPCSSGEDDAEWIVDQIEKGMLLDREQAAMRYGDGLLYFYCPYVPVIYMGRIATGVQAGYPCYATRYGWRPTTRDFKLPEQQGPVQTASL